jgi:hypothetical protein
MGPWTISILSSIPTEYHSAFNKAYTWGPLSPPRNESDCIKLVINGRKAITTINSQVRFNTIGEVPQGFNTIDGVPDSKSEIFYNEANEDIAKLLEWLHTSNTFDSNDAEYHYIQGIIFGFPLQDIRSFINSRHDNNKAEALIELDSLIG